MSIPIKSLTKLSHIVSHSLRHEPWLYELELDAEGWVPIDQLISAIKKTNKSFSAIDLQDLSLMIEHCSKKRHEIKNGKIRALYGHSTVQKITKKLFYPPEFLYHGTCSEYIPSIKENGLLPMNRQYVHLSTDTAIAKQVGSRKTQTPIILKIRAQEAYESKIAFYCGTDSVWLADYISSNFIEF